MPAHLEAHLRERLELLQSQHRLRDPGDAGARERVQRAAVSAGLPFIDASSNDYLGLGASLEGVSRETSRAGAGASRLVQGTWPEHEALEGELADWVAQDQALLFASGYAANLGTIAALSESGAVVLSDELNHASIIDGCRLGRGRTVVVPHLDLSALEAALKDAAAAPVRWVITESYFSMDGDGPDLWAVRELCDRHDAFLIVDEAHALGLYGKQGAGRCEEAGIRAEVLVGTFGKCIGSHGAFVAGSASLRAFLWNRARSLVFSTAPSPQLSALTLRHVKLVRTADAKREAALRAALRLRSRLEDARVPMVPGSFGPIIGLLAGASTRALELATSLREAGVLAQAIRAPTVPEGRARIRLTVTARSSDAEVDRLAECVIRAWSVSCRA
jgi:8-amino-7-oxononanoate synthase